MGPAVLAADFSVLSVFVTESCYGYVKKDSILI